MIDLRSIELSDEYLRVLYRPVSADARLFNMDEVSQMLGDLLELREDLINE